MPSGHQKNSARGTPVTKWRTSVRSLCNLLPMITVSSPDGYGGEGSSFQGRTKWLLVDALEFVDELLNALLQSLRDRIGQ